MKHKIEEVRGKGAGMLKCKRCGLSCTPDVRSTLEATKCPGRIRR